MPRVLKGNTTIGRRYALCIGIGTYTKLANRNLRNAVADATAIAEKLGDAQRGNFAVTLLTEPSQTTEQMLRVTLDKMLNAPDLNAEDLVVIYLSCHGNVHGKGNTFYLLPSDAEVEADGRPKKLTVIDIYGLTTALSEALVKNIIFLLDVCHGGGAGGVLEHLDLSLNPDTNLFIIGAARHDQVATQSSTLKHGIFTSCLLQAFEQKPHRTDGWLTITDILSFVTEAIKVEASKLSGQEALVQIQQRSASVNLNLLFIKNPHYSPESRDFHETVKKLLELIHYEPVQTTLLLGAPAGFYVAETKAGLRTYRVGIIPYYNQVEPLTSQDAEKIMLFVKEQVEQNSLNEGLVVTMLEVSHEVRETFQKSGARYLDVRTYESIWKILIDFRKYLQKLIDEYQTAAPERRDDPPLAKVYIPLWAERRNHKVNLSSADMVEMKSTGKFGIGYEVTWEGDLEEAVKLWLADADPAISRLALLGDYGSGKTTFCQHLAATLARNYLEAEEHMRNQQRIPLLIPLHDFSKNSVVLQDYLVDYLKQYGRVHNADAEALMKMAEAGLLLFMFDGFDEMASRAMTDTVRMNIELFEQLANVPGNKVLLTTRPEYFLTMHQEQQVLEAYPRLYLQLFNPDQVSFYLQQRVPFLNLHEGEPKKDWTYYQQQIRDIHDLSDLAYRPVLLEMIVKTLPVLMAEGTVVNRPNLYQRYLERELDRQIIKQRRNLLIDRKKRFEIMEQMALEMYKTDRIELTSEQIKALSRGLLTPKQQEEMEGSLREIVTCSFLIRMGDVYRFSHQSFLEYLVARCLAQDITQDKLENFRLKPLTLTIQDFLLELEAGVVQKSSNIANTDNAIVSFDRTRLESWFRANPKDRWLSTNAVSLLARLLPYDSFHQLPLQEADLEGANLEGANLDGINLYSARLWGANLIGASLRKANLQRADLHIANLLKANLRGADLRGARCDATLERADLREADLQGAFLVGANLRGADLRGADLRGADLWTSLRGVNLLGAILNETDLEGATFEGEDLEGAILDPAGLSDVDPNRGRSE